jgi:protein involved in polysaccharide export with SLBB domain/capsular polysaccharide biosynthesis protein
MKDNANISPTPSPDRNNETNARSHLPHANGNGHSHTPHVAPNRRLHKSRIDAWFVLDLLLRQWHLLFMGSCVCAAGFYLLGSYFVKPKFTASAQLLRFDSPGKSEYFKTAPVSGDTFAATIRAPELLRTVGERISPPVPPETLDKWIKVDPDPDSDVVKVYLAARDPRRAVDWLNSYITNAVDYMRRQEAKQLEFIANGYLKKDVEDLNREIKEVENQFFGTGGTPGSKSGSNLAQVNLRVSAVSQRLQKALTDLDDLRAKYTDIHPSVQAKQRMIDDLRLELAEAATNRNPATLPIPSTPNAAVTGETMNPQWDVLHIKLRALEDGRLELLKRQHEAELYAANAPGSVRVLGPATLAGVKKNMRGLKISVAMVFGAGFGLFASILLVCLAEFLDTRLKTAQDVGRVTDLPILASLGDLRKMPPQDRSQWAFRAWTMLQGRLSPSPNHGLICGITSSSQGEGRSTWISLLAEAASLTGFRVLTIATRPSSHYQSTDQLLDEPPPEDLENFQPTSPSGSNSLTTSVLTCPSRVTEQLTGPNSQPVVHIPLPGWVWNLERRKQWRDALNHWRQIDNLVILVELPPADVPEAVLLGCHLPNLVWLADSDVAKAGPTRAEIQTLHDARCNLVGAVINKESCESVRYKFPRWLTCVAALFALGVLSSRAQQPLFSTLPTPKDNPPVTPQELEPSAKGSFSIVDPSQRADWQRHLTLGPGDLLTFNLYGAPELTLTEIAVGPDGRVNYLEATNVLASGLTIDELRTKVDQELSKFRRAPHTMITPVAFRSKKYYVLGKVATKGVFTLDKPVTVLEAIARAHGFESALIDRHIVELADLQHSFLARGGKSYPLNFERLFQQGDLSQNIAVEPGDYLYFAPGDVQEVYVVGEIRLPGPVTYTPNLTIISAIAQRGGFTDRAFKARVVVVRGSLNGPTRFVANTHAILDAAEPNTILQPRDIIFVNSRPFIKVEEAADLAATAFIQSIITSWVGVDVVKPIQ